MSPNGLPSFTSGVVRAITHRCGRMLGRVADRMARHHCVEETWIDVGAYHGTFSLPYALSNPAARVYAFEPNLAAARRLFGRARNYITIPMAVAEKDGSAEFRLNAYDQASSLLPFDEDMLKHWIGGDALTVESVRSVPTIRLDTFMNQIGIERVDFLKIDAQGMDLAVLRSAGDRLRDIVRIKLEVAVTEKQLYAGAATKDEVVAFLQHAGFALVDVEEQSHGQEENLTFVRPRS